MRELGPAGLHGTLYLGYPVISSPDQNFTIDALLTTLEHGIVIFDFNGRSDATVQTAAAHDAIRARQDDLYTALYQKLLTYKSLRAGRELQVKIGVVTLTPDPRQEHLTSEPLIVSHVNIRKALGQFGAISEEQLRNVNAAIQRVTTIKPLQKRASVRSDASRGGIMKKIEAEIANLDRWQKRAAIETPDGPQRIRGLAGSGKTIVLALKAAYMHSRNPDWRIAVTFHTRSLYQQFRDLIRRFTFEQISDEPDWNRLRVLHAWGTASEPGVYSEICVANGIKPKDYMSARTSFGAERAFGGLCSELVDSLKGREVQPLFDAILIDEAQDLPQAFFELAYLTTQPPKRIIYAYDELQNLGAYSMAPPTELFGVNASGAARVSDLPNYPGTPHQDIVLPICYRNTPWALTIAHALGFGIYRDGGLVQFFDDPGLWEDIGYNVVAGNMRPGQLVELERKPESAPRYFAELLDPADAVLCMVFDSEEDQAAWLAESIQRNLKEDELERRDILIIISNVVTTPRRAAPLVRRLEDLGIPAHVAGVTTSRDVLFDEESVAITNIYRAKGNEAPVVYLTDSDYCYSGFELIKRRNILFTGITRSRGWVRLLGCGDPMEKLAAEVQRVVANGYKLRFTVPTPEELEKMRRIHRDMSRSEREDRQRMEKTLDSFVEQIQRGDLSLDQLPPDLREKLREIFRSSK